MHKIEDIISSLLLRHSCVIIPNFGGFVAKTISAKLDLDRGLFLAPSKQLLFNKNLLNNDGLLISEYASLNTIEYSKSQIEIEEFVLDLKTKLNSKQAVHIDRVGTLSYDLEGNLVFEQDRYFNLLLSSYGLNQVQFIANKEAEINKQPSPKQEKAPIRKINYLKYAAAACLLPLAFYSFWIPTHSGVLESGLISYKDFNPFYKKELGAYSQQKIAIQQNIDLEKNVFENQITTSKNHRIGLYKFEEGINIPIRIEEKKIVKKILDVKIENFENKISTTYAFEYIIGCFSNKNNALKLISKLKQVGFSAKLAGGSPLVRVSIGGAETDLQMQTIIQKANEKGYKGWVLKK